MRAVSTSRTHDLRGRRAEARQNAEMRDTLCVFAMGNRAPFGVGVVPRVWSQVNCGE